MDWLARPLAHPANPSTVTRSLCFHPSALPAVWPEFSPSPWHLRSQALRSICFGDPSLAADSISAKRLPANGGFAGNRCTASKENETFMPPRSTSPPESVGRKPDWRADLQIPTVPAAPADWYVIAGRMVRLGALAVLALILVAAACAQTNSAEYRGRSCPTVFQP
jgi:hypothetical protein